MYKYIYIVYTIYICSENGLGSSDRLVWESLFCLQKYVLNVTLEEVIKLTLYSLFCFREPIDNLTL